MTARTLADPETVGALAALMRLLGDTTRVRILGLLQGGERNVSELCDDLDLAQPTVSHHLGLLRTAGFLSARRAGKQVYYSLNVACISSDQGNGAMHLRRNGIHLTLGLHADE